MDKNEINTNFLKDLREICLYHSFVINGNFQCYDDLIDVAYKIDSENEKIIPVKIIYAGVQDKSLNIFKKY